MEQFGRSLLLVTIINDFVDVKNIFTFNNITQEDEIRQFRGTIIKKALSKGL